MDTPLLIKKAIAFDHGDARRIQHFLKVHAYAALIGRLEGLSPDIQEILEAAAILHDIGIHAAEEKHGSSAGKYQEIEGPAPAREILTALGGFSPAFIDRVCFLIAHHHTYKNVDGLDYQILLEADFLVNADEGGLVRAAIENMRQSVFRTGAGVRLLDSIYLREQ